MKITPEYVIKALERSNRVENIVHIRNIIGGLLEAGSTFTHDVNVAFLFKKRGFYVSKHESKHNNITRYAISTYVTKK